MEVLTGLIQVFNELLAQYPAVPFESLLLHDIAGEDLRCIPWYEFQERVDTKSQMKEIEESGDPVFIQYLDIPLYRWQDSGEWLFDAEDRITLSTRVNRFSPAEYLVILPGYDVFRVKEQLLNKLGRAGSEKAPGRNSRIYVESLFAVALKWLPGKALERDDPLHDMMSSSDFKMVVQNAIRTVHRIPLKDDLFFSYKWGSDAYDRDNFGRVKALKTILESNEHGMKVGLDNNALHEGEGSDI